MMSKDRYHTHTHRAFYIMSHIVCDGCVCIHTIDMSAHRALGYVASVEPNVEQKWAVAVIDMMKPVWVKKENMLIIGSPSHGALYKLLKKHSSSIGWKSMGAPKWDP